MAIPTFLRPHPPILPSFRLLSFLLAACTVFSVFFFSTAVARLCSPGALVSLGAFVVARFAPRSMFLTHCHSLGLIGFRSCSRDAAWLLYVGFLRFPGGPLICGSS